MGAIYNARAVICMADGDPVTALDVLREVRDITPPVVPAFTLVEAHLLAGSRTYTWGIETPPLPQPRQRSRPPSQTG